MIEAPDLDTEADYASQHGIVATHCGIMFSPLNPDPEAVMIEDIAHAESNSCRFTGHTNRFYSVAQHSVHVSELVDEHEPALALTALLHDASEAYLSDISRPIKTQPEFGDVYKKYEHRLEEAIAVRFGLVFPYPPIIKWADNVMLRSEQRDLMPDLLRFAGTDYWPTTIQPWSPQLAKSMFLERFHMLTGREASQC